SVNRWYETLSASAKAQAQRLFAKIAAVAVSDEQEKLLLRHGVLAFETLRQRERLERLDELPEGDLQGFLHVFSDLSEIEAANYHQIVSERLRVIGRLRDHVERNALEK